MALDLLGTAQRARLRWRDLQKAYDNLHNAGEHELGEKVGRLVAEAKEAWEKADAALPEWQRLPG